MAEVRQFARLGAFTLRSAICDEQEQREKRRCESSAVSLKPLSEASRIPTNKPTSFPSAAAFRNGGVQLTLCWIKNSFPGWIGFVFAGLCAEEGALGDITAFSALTRTVLSRMASWRLFTLKLADAISSHL